jgi:hypothetical protein
MVPPSAPSRVKEIAELNRQTEAAALAATIAHEINISLWQRSFRTPTSARSYSTRLHRIAIGCVARQRHHVGNWARFCRDGRAAAGRAADHRRRGPLCQPPIDRSACAEVPHPDDVPLSGLSRCRRIDGLHRGPIRAPAAYGRPSSANSHGHQAW